MRIEFTLIDDHGRRHSGAANLGEIAVDLSNNVERSGKREEQCTTQDSAAKGLPDHIVLLREEGFFREPRTSLEVHEKLQKTYSCLHDRVQMALLRLQRRRELRKATKNVGDQEKTAYVW